ncbi:MAG: mechanosensitive ion channel family protein [Desulfobacteraceae bacterium]
MKFNMKTSAFIVMVLCMTLMPGILAAAQTDELCIKEALTQIEEANRNQLESSDEESINRIINEKEVLITDLFDCIKTSTRYRFDSDHFSTRQRFLKTRLATNRSLGNTLAVMRDRAELNTIKIRTQIAGFISFLIQSQNSYADNQTIIQRTEKELAWLETLKPTETGIPGSGSVATALKKNIFELNVLSATYSDILHFTRDHITSIIVTSWFYYINLDRSIDTINSLKPMVRINRIISPLGMDMGRLTVVFVILALLSLFYPLVSFFSDRMTAFIARRTRLSDNVDIFYDQIKKPLKHLFLFLGIDVALTALSYKTDAETHVLALVYSAYSCLFLYLLFNVIDAVAIIRFKQNESRPLRGELINITIKFAKLLILIAVLSMALNHFGIQMTAILSTLGIGGLAFALAAKDTLSNLFGGFTILMDDLFRQGDWIIIQEVEGTVVEVGVRSTTIRTFDNALVTVPNSTIANHQVVNWSKRRIGRRIKMRIGITRESRIQDVKNGIEDISYLLERHPDIAKPGQGEEDPARHTTRRAKLVSKDDLEGVMGTQVVRLDRYSDYSMDILVYCFARSTQWAEWLRVKEEILYRIHEILETNHLKLAYPTEARISKDKQSVDKREQA